MKQPNKKSGGTDKALARPGTISPKKESPQTESPIAEKDEEKKAEEELRERTNKHGKS